MSEKLFWFYKIGARGWWHAESRARSRNRKAWKKAQELSMRITFEGLSFGDMRFNHEIHGTWTPEKPEVTP